MPAWLLPLLYAGSQAASAVGASKQRGAERESSEELTREQIEANREQDLRGTALTESMANPFRHQLDQGQTAARLDMLEGASYSPTSISMPDRYAKYKPEISGGFSWQPSSELREGAGQLKQSVLAGRTAPSTTNPKNYGKTATLDTYSGADPRTDAAFSTGAPDRSPGARQPSRAMPRQRAGVGRTPTTNLQSPSRVRSAASSPGRTRLSARGGRQQGGGEVAAFEQANPGWTIDDTGRVVRKQRA